MISSRTLLGAFSLAALLTLGACKGKVETTTTGDTSSASTTTTTPSNTDSGAMGGAVQGGQNELAEKAVEAALMAKEGYADVEVEIEGDGMVILTGTAASENEKAQAEVIAKNTTGVKGVTNKIEVKK